MKRYEAFENTPEEGERGCYFVNSYDNGTYNDVRCRTIADALTEDEAASLVYYLTQAQQIIQISKSRDK